MANDYQSNINKKLLKSFVAEAESSSVLLNTVSKQLVNDFDASTGGDKGAVAMKRPAQYVPQRSTDGDMTSGSTNPVRVGTVQGEVSNYITVFVENTQVEEALEADQLDQLMKPIAEDMVVTAETELAEYMNKHAQLISGSPDYAISKWADIASAGAAFKELGVPSGKRYAAINSFDETSLADIQTGLGVSGQVDSAWNNAVIRKGFAGFDSVMTTNNLPEYTLGSEDAGLTLGSTPVSTYDSYKNSYQMTLVVTGATASTGTLLTGQVLQIPAAALVNLRNHKVVYKNGSTVPFTCTVLEDAVADASGNITVSVSGAAIYETGVNGAFNTVDAAITSGDAVNIVGTADAYVRPALAYCEGFVGMGSVVLPKLHATDSMIVNHKGLSIRVHKFSDGVSNKNRYRFDMLPTFACFNPEWGMKVHGNA